MDRFDGIRCCFTRAVFLTALAAIVCVAVGCQHNANWPWADRFFTEPGQLPDKPHSAAGTAQNGAASKSTPADPFKVLADENWVLAVQALDQPEEPRYRWRHRALEDILDRPKDRQLDWQLALKSDKQIVRVNAAIALARLGQGQPQETLVGAVRATDLKLSVRRAAAEALGELHTGPALVALRELVDEYSRFTGEARGRYVPELHAELLRSLARQPNTAGDERIAEALKSPAPAVKREALEALGNATTAAHKTPDALPALAVDLATDADSLVRIAALKLLVQRQHPQAGDKVNRALSDSDLTVRFTAIELLGQTGGEAASAKLKKLAGDHAELVRVAAVRALAAQKDRESVEAAAADQSWRVRRAVATALKAWPDRHSATLVQQFLTDVSMEVEREAVRTISAWPMEQSGSLLMAAMESPNYLTRKEAAAQLADRWPAAAGFPLDAPAERRAELLGELQSKWIAEFGNIDHDAIAQANAKKPRADSAARRQQVARWIDEVARGGDAATMAIESLTALGTDLPPLLDAVLAESDKPFPPQIFSQVLPRCDKDFELINQLADEQQNVRRSAIEALARRAEKKSFSAVALSRITELLTTENDSVIWMQAFKLIEHDPREPATELAAAGMSHPAAEVRRRACGYFASYPDAKRSKLLVAALADSNISVLHAALGALAEGPPLADPAPVEKLLAESDHSLRLAAAMALARWKLDSGAAALERLAADGDPKIRRSTAQAIGTIGASELVPTLIKLLDDQQDIRRAALVSLHSITGLANPPRDSGVRLASSQTAADHTDESPAPLAEQAQRWKEWYRTQYQR
jgi:HEAT repeat protein